MNRDVAVIIPARLDSHRLPRKALANLAGKPLIEHVWRRVRRCRYVVGVYVATDSDEIATAVQGFGGEAVMTSARCPSGTDRVKEALEKIGAWGAVNVQGDEPFISASVVDRVARALADSDGQSVFTLVRPTTDRRRCQSEHVVKAVVTKDNRAQYFSRAPVPFAHESDAVYYEHVGVYGYSRRVLQKFVEWGPSPLERRERLEQLRFLENGVSIQVLKTRHQSFGIDTAADLRQAAARLRRGNR
jgi:3-deoxy-manno-octulosonate cytidylyltransferase (CMP-KDO synthetase)